MRRRGTASPFGGVIVMTDVGRSFARDEGAVALIVVIVLASLLVVASLVVDVGGLYAQRREEQTAADAAALAGVQMLPLDPSGARSTAERYATLNDPAVGGCTVEIKATYAANDTCEVHLSQPNVPLFFQRWANGDEAAAVGAMAVAIVTSPSTMSEGVFPFGIMSKEPSGTSPFGYAFNELVRLKHPAQQGEAGNFQFMSLTDPPLSHVGANDIMWALENGGVPNQVHLNTLYFTKTGINGKQVSNNMNAWIGPDTCSFDQVAEMREDGFVDLLQPDCHRVIVCPVIVDPGPPVSYSWTDMNGTSRPVLVIGFAYFYVEAIGTVGNDCWIDGRFIRPVGPDDDVLEWGAIDPLGAITYRLVR